MSYLQPQSVISPKDRWKLIGVVYDLGENNSSVAYGEWDDELCLASRWNGSLTGESSNKGNPISHFQPTWFVLPKFIAIATLKELLMLHATGDQRINQEILFQAINTIKFSAK